MDFFNVFWIILEGLDDLFLVFEGLGRWLFGHRPPAPRVSLEAGSGKPPWRWPDPPQGAGLRLEELPDVSRLHLPHLSRVSPWLTRMLPPVLLIGGIAYGLLYTAHPLYWTLGGLVSALAALLFMRSPRRVVIIDLRPRLRPPVSANGV